MADLIPKLLRVSEVAAKLGCSLATVYHLIDLGKLEHHRCPGVRVSEEQLANYLEGTKRGRGRQAKKPKTTRPRLRHIKLQ